MNDKCKEILKRVKAPTFSELLSNHIEKGYQAYDGNSHNTLDTDLNTFEEFCKRLYTDWYNEFLNYKFLNEETQKKVNEIKQSEQFNPKFIEKSNRKFPFYNFMLEIEKDNLLAPLIPYQTQGGALIDRDGNPNEAFLHIYGFKLKGQNHDKIDARLYLNLKGKNIPSFCMKVYEECRKQSLPFYFKFGVCDSRNDQFLFYVSYDKLSTFYEIINKIKAENPKLFEGAKNVSPNMGVIDGYIGFGDEPAVRDSSGHTFSYNSLRNRAINDIREELMKQVFTPKTSNFLLGNKKINFQETCNFYVDRFINENVDLSKLDEEDRKFAIENIRHKAYNQIVDWVLTGEKVSDITPSSLLKLNTVPFSRFNCEKVFENFISSFDASYKNEITLRGKLAELAFFHAPLLENEKKLLRKVQSELVKGFKEDIIDPSMQRKKDVLKQYINLFDKDSSRLDVTSRYQVLLSTANFLENKKFTINEKLPIGLSYYNHLLELYKFVIGEEKVNEIIDDKLKELKISKDNVAFNLDSYKELNLHPEEQIFFS